MSYIKEHKEGIILTILFHAALFLILLKFGFFTPLPLPEDKGVLVDFGNSSVGMGNIEPSVRPEPVQQKLEEIKEQVPPAASIPKTTVPEPRTTAGKEEVMTQDFEKTVAVDEGNKKREEEIRKKQEEDARKKREQDEIKRKEDLIKQQKENERLAESNRVAEIRRQDSIRLAQEQAKIAEINKRAQNVFGGSTGQSNNSSSSSGQGATYEPGNQGTATGTPGANQYGHGGGAGITFNLSGRSAETLPKPSYPGQEEGVVVVQVTVDKIGLVTKAEPGVRGSTSLDAGLLNAAKRAALSTRFNEDKNAPAFQTGTITYRFVLN